MGALLEAGWSLVVVVPGLFHSLLSLWQVQNYIANLQVNYNTSKASNLLTALSPRIKTLAHRLTIFLWFEGSTRSKASPYALCPVCSLSLYQHTMPTALYALPTDRRAHPSSRAV